MQAILISLLRYRFLALGAGLALVLLALVAVLALREAGARGGDFEVVYDSPLRVEHGVAVAAPQSLPVAGSVGSGEQARAELPDGFHNFGLVGRDSVVEHDFFIINRGAAPLLIRGAYTTCGCATAELSATLIPPGKASRVRMTFDAGFHPLSGKTVRRGLVLATNDPNRPVIEIWVQAQVR